MSVSNILWSVLHTYHIWLSDLKSKWKFIEPYNHKKAIRLTSFACFQDNCSSPFKNLKPLKLADIIKQSNILFTHNSIIWNTPNIFKDCFTFNEVDHQHDAIDKLDSGCSIPNSSLQLPKFKINAGKSSMKSICSSTGNYTTKDHQLKNIK